MDKTYLTLFTELAHTTEILAEQVMEKDGSKEQAVNAAKTMRSDYAQLYDRLRDKNFQESSLKREDYAKLLVGAIITAQQIENRIKTEQAALSGYKIDVIPKLERIVNESEDTEGAQKLAQEILTIEEKTKT